MKVLDILKSKSIVQKTRSLAFAPSNIALVKYWGKRDHVLNLPINSSLSISLGDAGATTSLTLNNLGKDQVFVGDQLLSDSEDFYKRIVKYLNLFRQDVFFDVHTSLNIPIAAGLASSAAGFAALALCLNDIFAWGCTAQELSILSRLGSGSAARSLWDGFVVWHKGVLPDGSDSFAEKLPYIWSELRIGICLLDTKKKAISSRDAMRISSDTSPFTKSWGDFADLNIGLVKNCIEEQDFTRFGETVEHIACCMHGLMLSSKPYIMYMTGATLEAINKVIQLRSKGLEVYFTEDAGPNLKLLFLEKDQKLVAGHFDNLRVINPWTK